MVLPPEDENITNNNSAIHTIVEVVGIKLLENLPKMAHMKICCIFSQLCALAATNIGSSSAKTIGKFIMLVIY